MNKKNLTLADLLNGIDEAVFFEKFFEKEVLYIKRADKNYYNDLFNEVTLNSILWSADNPWGKVQLANHNKGRGWKNYSELPPNLVTLNQAYQQGDSIIINDFQDKVESLAILCRNLAQQLGFLANINLYLTKGGEQGLSPHFDDQDVFILQISGRKFWNLYDFASHLPLDHNVTPEKSFQYDCIKHQFALGPGDLLYIPRGVGHAALADKTSGSLHLTLSVTVVRWTNIIKTLLQIVSENKVEFRKSIPFGVLANNKRHVSHEGILKTAKELAQILANSIDLKTLEKCLDIHRFNFISTLHPLGEKFLMEEDLEININTKLKKRLGIIFHCTLVEEEVHVFFPGGSFIAPASLVRVIDFVVQNEYFSVSSLPIEDSVLEDSVLAKVSIAHELIKQGIICKA